MTFFSKVGSFQTGTGTSNIVVTGLGFQPTIVFLLGTVATVSDTITDVAAKSFGAFTGSTARVCVGSTDDGAATNHSDSAVRGDSCLAMLTGAATDGLLDCISMDSDGFTVKPSDAFIGNYVVTYLALGGTELTNAKVGTWTPAAATGHQSITGVGFQPDVVILAGSASATALNANATVGRFSLGWMTAAAQATAADGMQTGVSTSTTAGITSTGRALSMKNSGGNTVNSDWDFVSLDADGFTLNRDTGTSQPPSIYIALKGCKVFGGTIAARTDTSTTAKTGVGFKPKAVMFLSGCSATVTANTYAGDARVGIGWSDGTNHGALATVSGHNIAPDAACLISTTRGWSSIKRTASNTFAVQSDATLNSLDADGFTWHQQTADSQATLVPFLAFGGLGADHCSITTQPAGGVDNTAFTTQPVIQLRDASNNAVAQAGINVVATIASGTGAIGGTATVATDASGVATFTTLKVVGYGNHTITFTPTALTPITSGTVFVYGAGAATKVIVVVGPSNTSSGIAISPTVTAKLQNVSSQDVNTAGTAIVVAIGSGAGTLGGTLTQNTVLGVSTFSGIAVTLASGADIFVLHFTSSGLTAADSANFVVYPASSAAPRNILGDGAGLLG